MNKVFLSILIEADFSNRSAFHSGLLTMLNVDY